MKLLQLECDSIIEQKIVSAMVYPGNSRIIPLINFGIKQSKANQQMSLLRMATTCLAKMAVACFEICKNSVTIE